MASRTRREFLRGSALAAAAGAMGGTAAAGAHASAEAPAAPASARRVNHDLHIHTVYSDGEHPIPLVILEARACELDAIAITDHHTPGSKIHDSDEGLERYLAEIERERSAQNDLLVLKGAEATALDAKGRVSIDARRASRLEWVLCDLGGLSEGTLRNPPADKQKFMENVVRTYLAMCDIPYIDAISHPFNTGNTTPFALPADYPRALLGELAAKMSAARKVFDVMNDMVYWFHKAPIAPREMTAQYVEVVRLFAAAGVKFQASSDDHRTGVGNTRWSELVLARAAVPPAQIVDPATIKRRE